jgi:hypothetical protein
MVRCRRCACSRRFYSAYAPPAMRKSVAHGCVRVRSALTWHEPPAPTGVDLALVLFDEVDRIADCTDILDLFI